MQQRTFAITMNHDTHQYSVDRPFEAVNPAAISKLLVSKDATTAYCLVWINRYRLRSPTGREVDSSWKHLPFLMILIASLTFDDAMSAEPTLDTLVRTFQEYSGARLVFDRDELPPGRYHDVLKPLDESARARAAAICVQEAKMYPPRYLLIAHHSCFAGAST